MIFAPSRPPASMETTTLRRLAACRLLGGLAEGRGMGGVRHPERAEFAVVGVSCYNLDDVRRCIVASSL